MAKRTISGTMLESDRPVWQPLLDLVGEELVEWFMWMFEIELTDGSRVQAYKHVATRRYIHLGEDGRAFAYRSDDRYMEISRREAIDEGFRGWEGLLPQPSDPHIAHVALWSARRACE